MNLGREAYTAYAMSVGGKAYDGRPLPTWEELSEQRRNGWAAAAQRVVDIKDGRL